MGETKDSSSASGTTGDDLVLGDGFSVVDSTKGENNNQGNGDAKKAESETTKSEPVEAAKSKESEPPKDDPKDDPGKVNGVDTKSDALLITTEEDLELVDKKNEESETKEEPEEKETKKRETKVDKKKHGDVWVSNITRHVKATDLKKHFTRHGKVLTAKIVTNGKSFFGYIQMENGDVANKCVKVLHGSTLDGRKITVSRQRPDQRKSLPADRAKTVKPSSRKTTTATTTTTESKKEVKEKPKEKQRESRDKDRDALAAARRNEERLKRDSDYLRREVARLKRFLSEEQRKARVEAQRNRTLTREMQELDTKLREERRKHDRDRETWEKNQRTDRVKLEADRSMIKKEMDEVKKLREYLKRKLEEEARPVERRPRASSPYAYSSKRFRDGSDKKYVEERTRTPPSPPKLSRSKNRSPVGSFDKERRSGGHGHGHYGMEREIEGRHGSSLVVPAKPAAPAPPRNIWPSSFHQEVWRVPPSGPSASAPFASSGQGSYRQSDYGGSSSSKSASYSQQRDFGKREHYNSGSVRKY